MPADARAKAREIADELDEAFSFGVAARPNPEWLQDRIEAAIASAMREARQGERERAAKECERFAAERHSEFTFTSSAAKACASAIRNLPEEP